MKIRDLLENKAAQFTPAERQLSSVLLADYPFSGLEPIQALSQRAHISAPSISRFVAKLGYAGFQEFQQQLILELKEDSRAPVEIRQQRAAGQEATLASYLTRIEALNEELLQRVTPVQFERICDMLGDKKRAIYLIGGRMSDSIAEFFTRHLRQIRENVYHIPSDPELWPEYLLRLRAKDVLVIIDFRRYQASLARLSERARARKAQTIVITDQWISPAAKGARELVSVPVDSGTIWDSYIPAFALVEALLVPLAERNWPATEARVKEWDNLRDEPQTGLKE